MRKHRDLYSLAENDLREEIQERKRDTRAKTSI